MELHDHHAYLIPSRRTEGVTPEAFLDEHGLPPGDARISVESFQRFGIDDARRLSAAQLRKLGENERRVYLIEADFITGEAQNALLKVVEEPSPRVHFVFATLYPERLLPTLRSRLTDITARSSQRDDLHEGADFLAEPPEERLKRIERFFPSEKERRPADRVGAEQFMKNVIAELHRKRRSNDGAEASVIGQLDRLHGYITDPSSSVKLILEYVAYVTPST